MSENEVRTTEIIHFLKENYPNYDDGLLQVINASENGIYFINNQSLSLSNQAKKLLKAEDEMSVDYFYEHINLQDRKKFIQLLNEKKIDNTPYEMIYRYKTDNNQFIWIKEHGIFNNGNKEQRIALITNTTKHIEQDEQLHRLAFYDSITQLKNRNYFEKDMKFLIDCHVPFALFLLDLNSFKVINDNFGHLFGDYILQQFSLRIKDKLNTMSEFDIYRLSGDEFAMIFPYLSKKKETDEVIEKIFALLVLPFNNHDHEIIITPSIGITFYPRDSKNQLTLLKYADISMYRAKNESFLNYSYFDKIYYKDLLEEKEIEKHLEKLMKEDLVTLHYQPIFNIKTQEIISVEALFYDETYDSEKIFSIAIKSYLIIKLEKYIIEKVIRDMKAYEQMIPEHLRFSINLTPKTAEHVDMYEEMKKILNKYEISGNKIALEITEQYFVPNEDKLNELMHKLQSLGIQIYLDDFGMGFSSVRNLTHVIYDHIKVDKRIIDSVFTNEKSAYFLKNIISFSNDIQCDIVIEGVENKEQLEYVQDIGGMYIQGYYLSKPIPLKDALELVKQYPIDK